MNEALVLLLRHDEWANVAILDRCAELSDEQLARTVEGTYGSIASTLVHIVAAEEGYLRRMTGQTFGEELDEDRFPGIGLLRDRQRSTSDALVAAAGAIAPDQVIRWTRDGFDRSMTAGMLFVQTINHSTEHRSQVMTILTQLGIEPPELDGWAYAEETGAFQERPAS
jgi:uncharacterized damage-inducible protein DinB